MGVTARSDERELLAWWRWQGGEGKCCWGGMMATPFTKITRVINIVSEVKTK